MVSVAPGEVRRITLAWWSAPDDPEPVLVAGPNGPCTVAIAWPCDRAGYVDVACVRRGEIEAVRWDLDDPQRERLRFVVGRWDLRQHDLLLYSDGRVDPCADSLRNVPLDVSLDRLVELAVARVAA